MRHTTRKIKRVYLVRDKEGNSTYSEVKTKGAKDVTPAVEKLKAKKGRNPNWRMRM